MKSSEIDLGAAIFDRTTGRVTNVNRKELELRHQSREVLAALVNHPGETVTREAMIDDVWSGREVAADSVAQCIAEIRRVLGDTDKRIIETVPREGYRLVLPEPDVLPSGRLQFGSLPVVALLVLACVFAFALQRTAAPSEPPVIAVLPFEDFSTAQHQGYLSDAVAESVITALARYSPQLAVISRRSSFQFRDTNQGVLQIAEQLGADFILEGSQQYDGSRLRITAQLIDGTSEAHIWAEEIDVPLGALLETNSRISRKIANAVGIKVVDTAEASMTAGDVSALMIANAAQSRIMRSFTRENLLKNIEEQEKSIKTYPNSAWGYLGQAISLRVGMRFGWIEGDETATRKRMLELARRGVELDPNNFFAYHALGRALMFNRDVEAAIGAFRRGVELNPSSSIVAGGLADALVYVGKTDEALEVIETMENIDPLYGFNVQWAKATALWQIEECDQALEAFQSAPSMPVAAYKILAAIHHCLGNLEKATDVMGDYLTENPTWTVSKERDINTGMWTAPGSLERWLVAMEAAGMPEY
ncbi:winged helix-turn-helix domain-containing protein [Pseudohalocynthiibacter sp. F2068]|uniref:winged helix-turn-helix domain-containing protein n=1 Tax=Pseudohalocynthiibacter sp. F2068 TaxID=2926418 RepID=UPI001FF2708F|nr:winged helix-turn-helix domain-containing protein [Pseudohalocynthiibacter sp. F2068]MCK0101825.1 winged helix-turn-helix domain-containing protein [Pseudohalocynthiibacter sp. F2068]